MAATSKANSEQTVLAAPRRAGRLIIPFVNTPPLLDVLLLLALLPVWWALGIDQFIWMPAGVWVAVRLGMKHQWRIRFPRSLLILACFMGAQLISALFIVETNRYVTFVRTFGAYVAALCIALVIFNEVKSWRDLKLILAVLIGLMTLMAAVGILAEIGVFRPSYTAPIGLLLPSSLKSTDYGMEIVSRQIGGVAWFSLLGNYYRLSGLFLYPTGYAPALMFTIPLTLFCFWRVRGLWKIVLAGAVLLMGLNLLFTTGRLAMVALVVGCAYFTLTTSRWRTLSRILLIAVCAALVVGIVALVSVENELPPPITTLIDDFVLARGPGSLIDRSSIYLETLNNAVERPIFGWGTERDLPTVIAYPAGSHDYYLGVLYKYGIVGLMIFVGMWIIVWRETAPPSKITTDSRDGRDLGRLLSYGHWIILGALINGLSEVLDLDTTVLVFLWIIIVVMICARQQFKSILASETNVQTPQVGTPP